MEKCVKTLLIRQSPRGYHVLAHPLSRARIRFHKVRLYHNLVGWNPRRDKLVARESAQRNVAIHQIIPGTCPAVPREHQRDRCGGSPRITIATVIDAAPKTMFRALLAYFAVTVKGRRRTQQPKIVERLYNRDASLPAHAIHGR